MASGEDSDGPLSDDGEILEPSLFEQGDSAVREDVEPRILHFPDDDEDDDIQLDHDMGGDLDHDEDIEVGTPDLGVAPDDDDVDPDLSEEPATIDEMTEHLRKKIHANFKHFLKEYKQSPDAPPYYREIIGNMARDYKRTLFVGFSELWNSSPTLGFWISRSPAMVLPILDGVVVSLIHERYPAWADVWLAGVRVSLCGFPPKDPLNGLKSTHLNLLISFEGVVSKRGMVQNEVVAMYIDCEKCGFVMGPLEVNEDKEVKPKCCAQCQSRGPFVVNRTKTRYRDHQRVVVQERPGNLLGARAPQSKECILTDEQVDTVRPGDEVHVTGIYVCIYDSLQNAQTKFPVFKTRILVNNLQKSSDETTIKFGESEYQQIVELAEDPNIRERIIDSVAPSIFGNACVKKAVALSMFGGQCKVSQGSHRMRGDINVLILGDPGMAKSQFLKYVERTFHRAVYTTGKGASAVGLTAGVVRDPASGEWALEGGAMVLADSGICLIDEFDKMNDQDRTSIHEAMEQQTISISKAGIVASLQARCAVIAAANPVKGVYDATVDFHENVNLTDPILSRFDILCVLRTEVDRISDERLADFVVCQHMKGHPHITDVDAEKIVPKHQLRSHTDPIPQEMLQKYILYARQKVFPKLTSLDRDKIASFYSRVRQECASRGGMQMTVRHVESMVRMAEANARMELRNIVTSKDVDHAIATMLECFCQSQKHQIAEELRQKFRGFIESVVDQSDLLHMKLRRLFHDEDLTTRLNARTDDDVLKASEVEVTAFMREAKNLGITHAKRFFTSDRFKAEFTLNAAEDKILRRE